MVDLGFLLIYPAALLLLLADPRPAPRARAREWVRTVLFGPNRYYFYWWSRSGRWCNRRAAAVTAGWYRHDVVAASPAPANPPLFDGPRPTKFAHPLIGPGSTLIQYPVMVSWYGEDDWDEETGWHVWYCDSPSVVSNRPLTREELELIRVRDERKG